MLLNCGIGEDSWEYLGLQEIKPVNPQRNQSWIFIGRTSAETETPILLPLDAKNWLIGKSPRCWKRLKTGGEGDDEDEIVGWHHWLDGHEFELALGVCDGQGGLACCSPWDHKELDYKESWAPKNWCFWTVVLEKTLESPLDCKEIQPVNPNYS